MGNTEQLQKEVQQELEENISVGQLIELSRTHKSQAFKYQALKLLYHTHFQSVRDRNI